MAHGKVNIRTNEQSQQEVVEGIRDVFKGYQKLKSVNPEQAFDFVVEYLENIFVTDDSNEDEQQMDEMTMFVKIRNLYEGFKILSKRLKGDEATTMLINNLAVLFETELKTETFMKTKSEGMSALSPKTDEVASSLNNFDSSPGKNTRAKTSIRNQIEKAQESQNNGGSSSSTSKIKSDVKKQTTKNTMSSPTKKKRFTCSFCGKGCSTKSNLKVHENQHTRNKLYECEYCQYQFTTQFSLIIHTRVHTGEKPFSCKHCQQKFSAQSNCSTHEKKHIRQAQFLFRCGLCTRGFNRPDSLDRHLLRQHK